jgi:hypothetical protein
VTGRGSAAILKCGAVNLGDPLRGKSSIDHRRNFFIVERGSPSGALYHFLAAGHQAPKFDFAAAAETLLSGAVFHFQREAEDVKTCVHRLVKDGGRDLGVREVGVDRECELDETRALLMEVSASACEPLDDDVVEIADEMPEVMRDVTLDERKRALQPRDHVRRADIRSGIVDDDRDSQHSELTDRRGRGLPQEIH